MHAKLHCMLGCSRLSDLSPGLQSMRCPERGPWTGQWLAAAQRTCLCRLARYQTQVNRNSTAVHRRPLAHCCTHRSSAQVELSGQDPFPLLYINSTALKRLRPWPGARPAFWHGPGRLPRAHAALVPFNTQVSSSGSLQQLHACHGDWFKRFDLGWLNAEYKPCSRCQNSSPEAPCLAVSWLRPSQRRCTCCMRACVPR